MITHVHMAVLCKVGREFFLCALHWDQTAVGVLVGIARGGRGMILAHHP